MSVHAVMLSLRRARGVPSVKKLRTPDLTLLETYVLGGEGRYTPERINNVEMFHTFRASSSEDCGVALAT